MSAIGDTGIGHGGTTTEEEYVEYEKHKNDPPRPSNSIDLSPALKEIKEIRQKALTSEPSPQTWNNAVEDAKNVRSKSLENAKNALVEAFAPAIQKIQAKLPNAMSITIDGNTMSLNENEVKLMDAALTEHKKIKGDSPTETGISSDDIDKIVGELNEECGVKETGEHNYNPTKSVKEAKKLIENFREKVAKYPKYISHEGSTVLCVLISVNTSNNINLKGLPLEDRNIILSLLPDDAEKKLKSFDAHISVVFDAEHDFVLTYKVDGEEQVTINLFNTVIHPNMANVEVDVPVVKDKDKISVGGGGNIILDKTRISKLIGMEPHKNNTNEEYIPRRQLAGGKNAFEIRNDIMDMALEYSLSNKNPMTPEEIVGVAKIFYGFVENRNR